MQKQRRVLRALVGGMTEAQESTNLLDVYARTGGCRPRRDTASRKPAISSGRASCVVVGHGLPRTDDVVRTSRDLREGRRTVNIASLPSATSWHDDSADTNVSDVVGDLARLADPTSTPRASQVVSLTLEPAESWMLAVVRLGMCVQAILDISPLPEDETLRLLARLIGKRVVTFAVH